MDDIRETRIQRIKGVRDVLPEEFGKRKAALDIIQSVFSRYGYRGVDVPTIEPMDLHLRKSGESIRRHMYQFKDLGQEDVCLRPELTASVARMFNQELGSERLPLRLSYSGSSFRYDKPQLGRYREFTQVGLEVIGGVGPEYDAEVIAVACDVMEALGITDYRVIIGSIGITLDILEQKKIVEKARSLILAKLEDVGKTSEDNKRERLRVIEDALTAIHIPIGEISSDKKTLIDAVDKMSKVEGLDNKSPVEVLITWVLEQIFISRETMEDCSVIAQNLLQKIDRYKQGPVIQEVLGFLGELTAISGHHTNVFPRVYELIEKYKINTSRVDELKRITGYLEDFGIDWSKVSVNFGFGRGLEYYTGMIFEIHCDSENLGSTQSQVCGGGRYDTLIRDLGGNRDIPALGFSFGLERLLLAMPQIFEKNHNTIDVLVAPVGGDNEFRPALKTAKRLRKEGLRAIVGPKNGKTRKLTEMANGLSVPFVIYIGENEINKNIVSLKNMHTGEQSEHGLDEAARIIRNGVETK